MVMTDEIQAGLLTGNLEVLVEPIFARFTQPFSAEAAGGTLVFKYNLLSFGRWMPFWDVGAGMLWTNLAPRIRELSTPLNFVIETGPGVQYFITEQTTLTIGVRYNHISNAVQATEHWPQRRTPLCGTVLVSAEITNAFYSSSFLST